MQCPKPALHQKLTGLNASQQSIEGTSKWLLFYSQDAATIVKVWYEEFVRAPADRKLALLYLANHVLQEGRKKGKDWVDEYAKVIVKAFRDFAQVADEKSRRSAERLVKVWEERRVFSPNHAKLLKDAIKAPAGGGTGAPSAEGAAPAPGGSGSNQTGGAAEEQRRFQAAGKLPDMLLDVGKAEQTVSFVMNRTRQIKANVTTEGSFAAVASARDVYTNCVNALQEEVTSRRKAIAELRLHLTRQEAGLSRAEDQVRSFEQLQRGVEDRFRSLQQQQAAAAAAAATAAAVPSPSAPRPPAPGGMVPGQQQPGSFPGPSQQQQQQPSPSFHQWGQPGGGPPGPSHGMGGPMGAMHPGMGPPGMPPMPGMGPGMLGPTGMMGPGGMPDNLALGAMFQSLMGSMGPMGPGAMMGGGPMGPPPPGMGMGVPGSMGPQPPLPVAGPQPPAGSPPMPPSTDPRMQQQQQHANGTTGSGQASDTGGAEAAAAAAAAAAGTAGAASPGLDFQLTDDMAAQLAAHLQTTNQDALLTLARALADNMPQSQQQPVDSAGNPEDKGLNLGDLFGDGAGSSGGPMSVTAEDGSPAPLEIDDYNPDDPI